MDMDTELIVAIGGFVAVGVGAWWAKKRGAALKTLNELADAAEELIEETTGIDVELNDVVDEVMEAADDVVETVSESLEEGDSLMEIQEAIEDSVAESAEEIQEEVEEVAESVAEELIDDLNENLEETLGGMTVTALREMLKERGLPVSGRKAELIQRLING